MTTAKEFLRNKGVSGDLNTLRLKSTVEEGTLVEWMEEYHKLRREENRHLN
jgi:hypothetical protein